MRPSPDAPSLLRCISRRCRSGKDKEAEEEAEEKDPAIVDERYLLHHTCTAQALTHRVEAIEAMVGAIVGAGGSRSVF
jgi:hypothetical protein